MNRLRFGSERREEALVSVGLSKLFALTLALSPRRGGCVCAFCSLFGAPTLVTPSGRQRSGSGVNALMNRRPAQRVSAFHKNTLDELVVEKPLTINELVEHASGDGIKHARAWTAGLLNCRRIG